MLVVADSSVLIADHQVDHLVVLRDLYTRVVVPPAVARETAPSLGKLPAWIVVQAPTTEHDLTLRLDDGKREALSLAMELCLGRYWLMIWRQDELPAFWPCPPSDPLEYWLMQSPLD